MRQLKDFSAPLQGAQLLSEHSGSPSDPAKRAIRRSAGSLEPSLAGQIEPSEAREPATGAAICLS
jgi:hypothetical protein